MPVWLFFFKLGFSYTLSKVDFLFKSCDMHKQKFLMLRWRTITTRERHTNISRTRPLAAAATDLEPQGEDEGTILGRRILG